MWEGSCDVLLILFLKALSVRSKSLSSVTEPMVAKLKINNPSQVLSANPNGRLFEESHFGCGNFKIGMIGDWRSSFDSNTQLHIILHAIDMVSCRIYDGGQISFLIAPMIRRRLKVSSCVLPYRIPFSATLRFAWRGCGQYDSRT